MKYLVLFVVTTILLNSTLAFGQAKDAAAPETASSRMEELRRTGLEALYNLDYEKARKDFSEIVRLYPDHPAGSQLLAARLWAKTLYESRRLQGSIYSSDSFYSKGDDKVDPKIVAEFRNLTRESKRLADARLKKNPRDVEALNFLAAIAGLKASFEEAVERRHFAALKDGSEAVDRHREVLKLDPTYIDAELTIGLYDYVLGSLPMPVRLLAGVAGARGSKKRGLAALERVAKEGRWSRDDAKSVLILLYTREKRYLGCSGHSPRANRKVPAQLLVQIRGRRRAGCSGWGRAEGKQRGGRS